MNTTAPMLTLSSRKTRESGHPEEFQQLELFEWTVNDPALESRNIPGTQVRRRNGLISLTDMWRVSGSPRNRTPPRWLRQEQTQGLLESLQRQLRGEITYAK